MFDNRPKPGLNQNNNLISTKLSDTLSLIISIQNLLFAKLKSKT